MATPSTETGYIGVLPSKMNGQPGDLDRAYEDGILDIAASFIRALDYSPPPYSEDLALKAAAVEELQSWNIGDALDGFMKYLDLGLAAAELFYPAHDFDLKVIVGICTAAMAWMDSVADVIIEAMSEFQRRFYTRLPQLNPVLDRYANYMPKLYDHFEPYVASAMIMSSCAFIDVSCLEIRALTKRVPTKKDAKLWPYYVRNLSGIAAYYAFACFPQKDHPDLVNYVQAIPEITIFINFLNDVLSFYKEEMDGEQHNYCQMMSRVSERPPISVLEDVAREALSSAKVAEQIMADSPAALKAFKDYIQGYIRWHLDVARYRLPASWKAQFSD
ncbi:terpenoid synthase [Peniophora sp. CONT]|nr:terpenoid synthase [Peniophora sp. CONT]